MTKPSMYEELMKKYDIVSIKGGSDLALDLATGGLMMSKRGDLMWKGKAHNSMFQFVRDYEMNAPKLKSLFAEIVDSHEKEATLVDASNNLAEEISQASLRKELKNGAEMHALSDARGAFKVGREVCAASIFVTLNNMLQALKDELEIDQQKFLTSTPQFSGQSFGNVVWAASNNARHADEWRVEWVKNGEFNKQQLKSVEVLAPVLGYGLTDYRFLAGEICAPILAAISNDTFDLLELALFTYANSLAAEVENIK